MCVFVRRGLLVNPKKKDRRLYLVKSVLMEVNLFTTNI